MNFSDLSWEEKMILEVAQPLGRFSNSHPGVIYLEVTLVKSVACLIVVKIRALSRGFLNPLSTDAL